MQKVSVIMPVLNRAWIVGRAIESVLSQSYRNFELVIINDGSTDKTASVAGGYKDERIVLLNNGATSGLAAARNTGIKKARGELVAYLDSDNLWYPQYLEVMMQAFDKSTVMVYSGQNLLIVGGTKEEPVVLGRKTRNEEFNPVKLIKGNYIDVNCVVHKRNVLVSVGYFDESLSVLEDWDLFVRIAIKYPFAVKHIDQIMGEYYYYLPETETTLSNQKWQDWINGEFGLGKVEGDELKIFNKIKSFLKLNSAPDEK